VPDNALPKEYGCGQAELDDVENKNILKELWVPFKLAGRNLRAKLDMGGKQQPAVSQSSQDPALG
jgi:hypothetical protein